MKFLYKVSIIFISFITLIAIGNLIFKKQVYYQDLYQDKVNVYVHSLSTPRGRILDIHGKVLVDNVGVKAIVYRKLNQVTVEEEIKIAYQLADFLSLHEKTSLIAAKKFWLIQNKSAAEARITKEERVLYERRKLTSHDLYYLKLDRITEEDLAGWSELDLRAACIYELMHEGYSYDAKVIKLKVSDEEYSKVLEAKLPGVTNEMYFERYYPYGNTLKSLFGSVGRVPEDAKNEYMSLGYSLNDLVGISYLEKQYESFLKGEKDTYKVKEDGSLSLVSEGKRGNDLVLSLDIDMQLGIENIVKEQIKKGKTLLKTNYYHGSYVLVSDVSTGAIKSIVGLKYLGDDVFLNQESDVVHHSFTVGSVVKGASMAMAYQNGLVDIGKTITDSCVKLYMVPEKCSYKKLGRINDITAIKTSSNYYQFLLAIRLAGYSYSYNMKLPVSNREFSIYRNAFASFGLGVATGIDLPTEATGMKGNKIAADLLLNLAIGQYDTYTPIQVLQYMNTLANHGNRYALSLLDHVEDYNHQILYEKNPEILSTFSLDSVYFERIQEGLRQVVQLGTGYGYTDRRFHPAGKTGTSESLFDSDGDGIGDVFTITNSYAMYAPFENPKYSMVVISPNVSVRTEDDSPFPYVNRYISKAVSDYLFSYY